MYLKPIQVAPIVLQSQKRVMLQVIFLSTLVSLVGVLPKLQQLIIFIRQFMQHLKLKAQQKKKINKLQDILEAHGIAYHLVKPKTHMWHSDYSHKDYLSLDDGYIDHSEELQDFVDELLNDENKLLRFLGGGLVFTGNDNSTTQERCFISRDEEYLDDYNWRTGETFKIKNPYYMSDHEDYEWYYKGN